MTFAFMPRIRMDNARARWHAAAMTQFLRTLLLVLLAFPALAREPRRLALLAGVSDYPAAMVGDLQLRGPKHDVALMMETMERAGFAASDTIVLADGLEETGATRKADGLPTKRAIMDALASLAARAEPGDTVLVYLTGHGSRQPDLDPGKRAVPKPDNLDEIFLPLDIGPWSDEIQTVANALPDYELGRAVEAIRATGALVWVVVDACHSGTMTRSTDPGSTVKQVPPARLGIPQAAFDKASAGRARGLVRDDAAEPARRLPGDIIAFFAAWPDQTALEENLPRSFGADPGKRPHGVLTFYLAQAMRGGQAATYRDLAHRIMAGYGQFGARAPAPMFEGDLSQPLPGVAAAGPARFPVKRDGEMLAIEAGALDGFSAGAIVALATAEAPAVALAYATVEATGAARSLLRLTARDGKEASLANVPKSAFLVGSLAANGVDLTLRVAAPPAVDALFAHPAAGLALDRAGPGAAADVFLREEDGRVWLIPADGRFDKTGRERTPSLDLAAFATPEAAQIKLTAELRKLAKAGNLIRVAAAMEGSLGNAHLVTEAFLLRDAGPPAAPGAKAPDDRACPVLPREPLPAAARPASLDAMPALRHCDTVFFRLSNTGAMPLDVTALYIDGGGAITDMGPKEGLRLTPGGAPAVLPVPVRTWDRRRGAPYPVGRERLLLIAVEVDERQSVSATFGHLAQAALERGTTAAATPLAAFLETAAFGSGTRSVAAPAGGTGMATGMASFGWTVAAPAE